MSSTNYDPRLKPICGAMNGDTLDEYGPYLTEDTLNTTYALDRAVEKGMESEVTVKFPRIVKCIYAEEYNEDPLNTYTPIWNVSTYALGFNTQKRIRIKAYDDFLDSCIKMPNIGVDYSEWTDEDRANFNLLPWYYLDSDFGVDVPMPSMGDIVIVDFVDRENLRGGRFLSIKEKVTTIPMATALPKARGAFSSAIGAISTIFNSDPGSDAATPPYASVEDLCPGPIMEKGSRFGGGTVETVIIDGCPVAKDVAGFYISMRDAAFKDGVTLKLNSGFRGYDDVVVPDECGNGIKSGQDSLYAQYGPGRAAKPGSSQHQNGIAFDIQTGMPKDQVPHPSSLTKEYKWLIDNAHNFGFVRTVRSERWHWEYQPGSSQFAVVSKDHPTWDNYV